MPIFSRSSAPAPVGRIASFTFGFSLPVRAARLILRHPALMFWSAIPIAITVALYFYVLSALQQRIGDWVAAQLPALGVSPEGTVAWVLLLVLKLLMIVISAATFSIVATIVASPFNDFLAESSERWMDPALPPPVHGGIGTRTRLILIDLAKSVAAGVATVIALLVSWLPVVNVASIALVALLVCFQYISYAQTRRAIGLRGGLLFLIRYSWACAGLGAVLSLLFAVPLISSLALPLAVVSGTILVARAPGSDRLGRLR